MKKIIVILLTMLAINSIAFAQNSNKIALIVAKDWTIDAIDMNSIKNVFLKQTKEIAGEKLEPVQREDSEIFENFSKKVIGMDKYQYENHWIKNKLNGGEDSPRQIKSLRSLITFVSKKKGAISYVLESEIDEPALTKVKILPIKSGSETFTPDKEGYPLSY